MGQAAAALCGRRDIELEAISEVLLLNHGLPTGRRHRHTFRANLTGQGSCHLLEPR